MATGMVNKNAQLIILPNAFTFSSTSASQTIDLSSYKDCFLLDIYTNNDTLSIMVNSYVVRISFNRLTGELYIERTSNEPWAGSSGKVILLRA